MEGGLKHTERVLAASGNRAVLPLLAAALGGSIAEVRAAAIRGTLRRRDIESHTQLLHRFDQFDEEDKAVLRSAYSKLAHHAAPALKAALLKGDVALCRNACHYIECCHAYDMSSVLVKALEQPRPQHAAQISATFMYLARTLHDEFARWHAGDRTGHDPSFARHQVLSAAEKSLSAWKGTPPKDLVDAFLLLAPNENESLLKMMSDSRHACHTALVAELAGSSSPAIIGRLVDFLQDTTAPVAVLEVIGNRTDPLFVGELLRTLKHPVPLRALQNMKQVRSARWLQSQRDMLLELDGRSQAIAVDLAVASGMPRDSQFELLKLLLSEGLVEGRRASCQALAGFNSPETTELVLGAMNDPDAAVQAAALRQLRARRVPNGLALLVTKLESPNPEIRDAARSSLAEFNFVRYRSMFDLLDDAAARTTGILVRQVDPSAVNKLNEELHSPSESTKVRGIEMAVAMEAVEDVRDQLIELARHENVAVRKEAVAALAAARGPAVVAALAKAARDSNRSVADAAQEGLARIEAAEPVGAKS